VVEARERRAQRGRHASPVVETRPRSSCGEDRESRGSVPNSPEGQRREASSKAGRDEPMARDNANERDRSGEDQTKHEGAGRAGSKGRSCVRRSAHRSLACEGELRLPGAQPYRSHDSRLGEPASPVGAPLAQGARGPEGPKVEGVRCKGRLESLSVVQKVSKAEEFFGARSQATFETAEGLAAAGTTTGCFIVRFLFRLLVEGSAIEEKAATGQLTMAPRGPVRHPGTPARVDRAGRRESPRP
jgi:hypothetical protein